MLAKHHPSISDNQATRNSHGRKVFGYDSGNIRLDFNRHFVRLHQGDNIISFNCLSWFDQPFYHSSLLKKTKERPDRTQRETREGKNKTSSGTRRNTSYRYAIRNKYASKKIKTYKFLSCVLHTTYLRYRISHCWNINSFGGHTRRPCRRNKTSTTCRRQLPEVLLLMILLLLSRDNAAQLLPHHHVRGVIAMVILVPCAFRSRKQEQSSKENGR